MYPCFQIFCRACGKNGATVPLREGYGLTESVTVCSLTPESKYKPGSIGIPFPDMRFKIIDAHDRVSMVCDIGIPDAYQIQKVKAFIVLKNPDKAGPEIENELTEWCRQRINKWSCPRKIEFRTELPQTKVGKIAYRELELEELDKAREIWQIEEEIRENILDDEDEVLRSKEKVSK